MSWDADARARGVVPPLARASGSQDAAGTALEHEPGAEGGADEPERAAVGEGVGRRVEVAGAAGVPPDLADEPGLGEEPAAADVAAPLQAQFALQVRHDAAEAAAER